MKFDEALKMMNNVNIDKWFTRYKPYDKYLFMGCEGRIMRRSFWKESDYFILSNMLTRKQFEDKSVFPKNKLIFISNSNDLPFADKKATDWEVYDLIPNQRIKVNIGEKGYWGK